ncbi:MAG: hypothetical protein VX777_10335 [Chlamydiota bacterium]|nr:hypothetical protein [Chlamydiota bacterium]
MVTNNNLYPNLTEEPLDSSYKEEFSCSNSGSANVTTEIANAILLFSSFDLKPLLEKIQSTEAEIIKAKKLIQNDLDTLNNLQKKVESILLQLQEIKK